jgi:CubicO group peptidase (beta-lactamase class C family)
VDERVTDPLPPVQGTMLTIRKAAAILGIGLTIALAGFVLTVRPDRMVRVGTALTSHTLCSEAFVAGLDPNRAFREILKPMPKMWLIDWGLRIRIDPTLRQVTTSVEGLFPNRAIYRPGLGCLVVHGPMPRIPLIVGESPEMRPDDPLVHRDVVPTDPDLRAAVDREFSRPDRRTQAVIVMQDGRIIAERYAPGIGPDTPLLGWSATKSVLSALIGILVREGRLTVSEPAPVSAWQGDGDPRKRITVDELLRMTSGIDVDEKDNGLDPFTRALFLKRDMAGFVERAGLESAPGTHWNYTGANATILSRILRDSVGGNATDVVRFARRELFDPLGMHHVTLEFDATGTPVGAAYMFASARDWARFGMLYADDGIVDGRRILPKGWARYSAQPTPEAPWGYGAGFWTNLGSSPGASNRRRMGMPGDSFFASGLLGQYVVVVPSERLVVARFGETQNWPDFDIDGVSRLVSDVVSVLKMQHR